VGSGKGSRRYESSTLLSQGFIHLSRPEQVHLPANALYSETSGLLLLWIDPSRLASEIRDEPPAPGAPITFPHLYGPLNLDAVVAETPLPPWKRGEFELPPIRLGQ
jgi:glutathione S-transferase